MSSPLSSVRSSADNSPFVPSPRWLSDSPGRPPSVRNGTPRTGYIDRPGAANAPSPQPDSRQALRSPVPPPPENLHAGQTAAFNVDPGIPFLATAGPTDDGQSSAGGSVRADEDWPSPRERKFGGGIVSGLKRAVGSLRLSSGSRVSRQTGDDESYVYTQPPQFRDSGYGHSTPHLVQPQGQTLFPAPPPLPHGALLPLHAAPPQPQPPPHVQSPSQPQPIPLLQPQSQAPPPATHSSSQPQTPFQIRSPPSTLVSPISADPDYGSDYAQMDPPTPPPSDTPLTTYLSRAQRLIAHVAALPWVAPERVTADYYPERAKRSDEMKHAPQIRWAAQDYTRPRFRPVGADDDSEAGTWEEWEEEYEKGYERPEGARLPAVAPLITPRRGGDIDLGEEFEEARNTPVPTPAPGTPYGGGGASLYGGYTPRTVASRMPTPSLYARPMTPAAAAAAAVATPGGAAPPLPQDPPSRMQTPAVINTTLSRPPSTAASAYPQPHGAYATPGGAAPPPPQDPPTPRIQTPAARHASTRSRPPSAASAYQPPPPRGAHPAAPGPAAGGNNPARPRSRVSDSSSMYTYTQPGGGAGSQTSSRSRRSTTSARLAVPARRPGPAAGAAGGAPLPAPVRARGASVASSSAYGGERAGPGWDSGYAESFGEDSARGGGGGEGGARYAGGSGSGSGYGVYVPPLPPPLPVVGVQSAGAGSVRSVRSGAGREWGV